MPNTSHFLSLLKLNEVLHGLLLTHEFNDPKANPTNLLFLKTHLLYLKLHLHLVGNAVMGNCPYFLQGKLAPSIERQRNIVCPTVQQPENTFWAEIHNFVIFITLI